MKKSTHIIRQFFEFTILVLVFLLANRRAWYCFFILENQDYYCLYGSEETDFTWWGIITIGIVLLLWQRKLLDEYLWRWKANWPLLIFIGYSLLSLLWTVDLARSLHTVYILLAASLAGAGMATMYSREQIFRMLLWFAGVTALASLVAVLLFPQVTVTAVSYLAGAWRGVFAHKNYLGSVMGFANALFLFYALQSGAHGRPVLLGTAFCVLTLFLVIMSRSATGLIIILLLNGLIVAYVFWRRWRARLQNRHYVSMIAVLTLLSGLVLVNLDRLLSLIGKRASLTGRVPLWQYLFDRVVRERPWLGYGWETLWYERSFQAAAGTGANWGIIAVNGHSGYMDILVYLGIVGLAIFLLMAVQGVIGALRSAADISHSYSLLPLLILLYVLATNTTISYFLEFESFHWLLLIVVLFMTASSAEVPVYAGRAQQTPAELGRAGPG